jgi:hypothetical protein
MFCAIWRTGSPESCQWHRSLPVSRTAAEQLAAVLSARGLAAHVERHDRSVAIGLPEGWEYGVEITETGAVD